MHARAKEFDVLAKDSWDTFLKQRNLDYVNVTMGYGNHLYQSSQGVS